MNLGPYTSFIIASYGLAALVIGGLTGWLIWNGQRQLKALAALEARGIRRRSSEG